LFSIWQSIGQNLWRILAKPGAVPRLEPSAAGGYFPSIRAGRLVYSRGFHDTNIWRQKIPPADRRAEPPVSLISSTADDTSPQYSPDGARIAFGSERSGSTEIWTCANDGGRCIQLTSFNGPHTGTSRWSPDGKRIAFDCSATGSFGIYVVNADGGVPKRLMGAMETGIIPSWSRDSKWLYFASTRTGGTEIWKMESEGGKPVQVTRGGGFAAFESPDGKRLYYMKSSVGSKLWRSELDGSGSVEVLDAVVARGFAITSETIFYLHPETAGGATLRSFALATGAGKIISSIRTPLGLGLSVSPGGEYILYTQVDQDGSDLMLVAGFK
jgi:dipeptidyl aminopeptidase/acylaminoacyl peptidase